MSGPGLAGLEPSPFTRRSPPWREEPRKGAGFKLECPEPMMAMPRNKLIMNCYWPTATFDYTTLHIAVGLRLGTAICAPYPCQLCGSEVSSLGLSCRKSEGRHSRHASLNDHQALGVPSRLEPPGLSPEARWLDSGTMEFWYRPLVWDATCPDTFASSYRGQATREAGGVAAMAEGRKCEKYAHLAPPYFIQPIAIETSGAVGPSTLSFLMVLGKHISLASGEPRLTQFLLQIAKLSMLVHGGMRGQS